MQRIKFTAQGSHTAWGNFGPGDTASVDDRLAQHLVEQAGVAVYVNAAPVPPHADQAQDPAPKRTKRAKPPES